MNMRPEMSPVKLLAFSMLCGINFAQLSSCPVAETTIVTNDGSAFRICPNSDYEGTTTWFQPVDSITSCTQLCTSTVGCSKAVYDQTSKGCHLKGDQLVWVSNRQYSTIRYITRTQDGTPIQKCPTGDVAQGAGDRNFLACSATDFRGPSVDVIGNVASTGDCTTICGQRNDCQNAVYDTVSHACHIKSEASSLTWVTDTRFDVIRLDVGRQDGTTSSTSLQTSSRLQTSTTIKSLTTAKPSTTKKLPTTSTARGTQTSTKSSAAPSSTPVRPYRKTGNWSEVFQLPVIPVAAFMVAEYPFSTRLLAFSAYATNDFGGDAGYTQFADYNFVTGAVSQRTVSNTRHDMFCPGISMLGDGRILVNGGSSTARTSLYDASSNSFIAGPDMKLGRGYQSSAALSNGKVFTIGGSWSGGMGGKDGEIFDPSANRWTKLAGARVSPMLTADSAGIYRQDNHGWLLGWKDGYVFQAGPSKAMNWYNTKGAGSVKAAGVRDTDDAMCGVFAMYDAVAGKILSAAGAPDYSYSPATTKAHIITIGSVDQAAQVERLPDLAYPRGYASSVVLPDGTVLITGGQRYPVVFTDTDSIFAPEIFDPNTKTFKALAPAAVPRNYHSVSLLLPDGTVFNGGGGMCGVAPGVDDSGCNRSIDHPNGQIFSPPYLFNEDGSLATRPIINALSSSTSTDGSSVRVGGTLVVQMDRQVTGLTFSAVRMGTVTHTVNTDQRRVPLSNVVANGDMFTITLPADAGIMLPGNWYLFAISAAGVPSIARTVRVLL